MWNIIYSLTHELNCAIVLTTHSMEEAEALSSKLAIMANGEFKCFGSI